MDIDLYCEHFCNELRARAIEFAAELRRVSRSEDYAQAVASLTRLILSTDIDRALWINDLGLMYCAFCVPSNFFVNRVVSCFRTHDWQLTEPNSDRFADNWGFRPLTLSTGVVHIHFAPNALPQAPDPVPATEANDPLVLTEDFLAFTDEYHRHADAENVQPSVDNTDPRLTAFLARNERILGHLFGSIRSNGKIVHGYWEVIHELANAIPHSAEHGGHLYAVPTAGDGDSQQGVFYFLFSEEVRPPHGAMLRFVCERLFSFLRSLDRLEFSRRTTLLHSRLAAQHSDLHALRNALGALQNTLQLLRGHKPSSPDDSWRTHVHQALRSHTEVLKCLDNVEAGAISSSAPRGPLTTVEELATLLRSQWGEPPTLSIHAEAKDGNLPFALSGPLFDLGQALYQFVEVAICKSVRGPETTSPFEVPSTYRCPRVFIHLYRTRARLFIRIHNGDALPKELEQEIHSVNILDRLPSNKPQGGRGILRAIQTLRVQFQGECHFVNDHASWFFDFPVAIGADVEQYTLFGEG
jgi:hypothetical protein